MAASKPLFSIVLPIYNVEKYLAACIDSVLNQTFKDFEIILVDDGSTDSSPAICDEYAKAQPCATVHHFPNGGLSEARNRGLRLSTGTYVLFLDSDDYLRDEYVLEKIARRIEKTQADVVAYKFVKWFEASDTLGTCPFDFQLQNPSNDFAEVGLQLTEKDAFYNSAWSKVVRISLLKDNGVTFQKGLLGEDNDWYYHVALCAKTIDLIDEPLYVYRQREGSITKTVKEKNLTDMLWIFDKWTKLLVENQGKPSCKVIEANMAKQYCNTIITYSHVKGAEKHYAHLLRYKHLLSVGRNKRVVAFRWVRRLIGMKGLIFILKRL